MRHLLYSLKLIVNAPFAWPCIILYFFSANKHIINKDLVAWAKVHVPKFNAESINYSKHLYREFISYPEFRSLFYHRIGKISIIIRWLYKPQSHLAMDCPNIGEGLFIQHGYCTDLSARSIGKNCWINQRVTLGYKGNDCPTIGDNVRIGVGAIIIGNVHIGDNVNIGAGAIVVKDVPNNCTICPPKAQIVKYH